jgi:hypothetical protein
LAAGFDGARAEFVIPTGGLNGYQQTVGSLLARDWHRW